MRTTLELMRNRYPESVRVLKFKRDISTVNERQRNPEASGESIDKLNLWRYDEWPPELG